MLRLRLAIIWQGIKQRRRGIFAVLALAIVIGISFGAFEKLNSPVSVPAPAHSVQVHSLPHSASPSVSPSAKPSPSPSRSVLPVVRHHHPEAKTYVTYTVQKGDTLWSIAVHYWHNGSDWHHIYQLNHGKIRSPGLIYSGQVLRI